MDWLKMCFQGSVIIIVVVVCRALFINKLPKKVFLILWAVALFRLLVPYSVTSVSSIYFLAGQGVMERAEKKNKQEVSVKDAIIKKDNKTIVQNENNIIKKATRYIGSKMGLSVWMLVWLVGFIISVSVFITAYILCYRRFCTSLPVSNEFIKEWLISHKTIRHLSIRQSGFIKSPLSYGIFCPVILMPKTTNWDDLKKIPYILEHEFVHVKRFDAVIKLFLIIAVSIYWFNPLVWVMYILLNRDIELSCDETVVRHFGEKSKATYALVLIDMEEEKSSIVPLGSSFNRNAAEERITAIMQIKSASKAVYIKSFLLIAIVVSVFATSANGTGKQKEESKPKEKVMQKEIQMQKETQIQKEPQIQKTDIYSNVLGEIAASIAEKEDYNALTSLAPFVEQKDLDKIAKQIVAKGNYNPVVDLAPFLSKDTIYEITKQLADKGRYSVLENMAQFL